MKVAKEAVLAELAFFIFLFFNFYAVLWVRSSNMNGYSIQLLVPEI